MENLQVVSALEEPEKAAEIAAAAFSMPNDVPEPEPLPDGSVTLPGGYRDMDGTIYTEAVVRELNGADEEMLAKPEVVKNLGRFTQLLLQRGVTRIGPYENPDNNKLGSLLLGDRDMLLLAIRCMTYDTTLEMEVGCPACGESLTVKHDLKTEIPIKTMEDPNERDFVMQLRDGSEVKCLLAVGSDQEAILSGSITKNTAELSSMLLARCVMTLEGKPLGLEGVRRLGIKDRRTLLEEITGRQPGPQYNKIDLTCAACAKEFPMRVDLLDLFR
jgi:hypothetical protein